jgi:hypothetical protein
MGLIRLEELPDGSLERVPTAAAARFRELSASGPGAGHPEASGA